MARQIKFAASEASYWPLTGPTENTWISECPLTGTTIGWSSPRGMTVFLTESRERSSRDGMAHRSQIHYESLKIKRDSALHHHDRAVFFHEVLWFMSFSKRNTGVRQWVRKRKGWSKRWSAKRKRRNSRQALKHTRHSGWQLKEGNTLSSFEL